jgi:hypothetical protein
MIDELKVVLCADDFTIGYLPMLMAQLSDKDVNHELVAVSKPFAWKKKVRAWLDGLGSHHGKAVFIDAYDVLMFGTAEELYHKITSALIFSGDRVCWPASNLEKRYHDIGTPWKFVNSGGIAGHSDALRDFLNMIHSEMKEVYPPGQLDCEQFNCTVHYLRGKGVIDKDCRIFHSMLNDPPGTLAPIDFNGPRWMNTYTGTIPVFIHGQGKSFVSRPDIFPPRYKNWNWY